jgi:hypothetical protein
VIRHKRVHEGLPNAGGEGMTVVAVTHTSAGGAVKSGRTMRAERTGS